MHTDNIAPSTQAQGWLPVTPQLLDAIMLRRHGRKFWIKCNTMDQPVLGEYQLEPGRSPHGFNLENGARWRAKDVTHVLPVTH